MNSSGKRHDVGAHRRRLIAGAAHLVGVAGDVADGRIELRQGDLQAIGGSGVHADDLARRAAFPQCARVATPPCGQNLPLACTRTP